MPEDKEKIIEQLWDYFEDWCMSQGVNTKDREDWENWWDCWYDGFSKAAAILHLADKDKTLDK